MPSDESDRDALIEVWFTLDRERFFLIPKGSALPVGDDVIRGPMPVRRRRVDLAAITVWEVPKDQALAEIDRRVGDAVSGVRGFLGRLVDKGREAAGTPGDRAGVDEIPDLDPKAVVGLSAGELLSDPDGARKAVSGLLDRAADAAEVIGAVTDPIEKAKLKDRLHDLEHDLLDADGAVPRKLRELERDLGDMFQRVTRSLRPPSDEDPSAT